MNKLEFDIYVTPDGKCPFDDWYNELPAKDASKLDAVIAKIQEQGIPVALKMIAFQMLVSASSPASVGFDYMLMPRTRARCG